MLQFYGAFASYLQYGTQLGVVVAFVVRGLLGFQYQHLEVIPYCRLNFLASPILANANHIETKV